MKASEINKENAIMAGKFDKMGKLVFTLDCQGFASPLPQKYTKKMLKSMSIGDILEVILDNPSSSESIMEICSGSGNHIIDKNTEEGKYIYRIKKGYKNLVS
jgi:TusA-related sulfurtransferase